MFFALHLRLLVKTTKTSKASFLLNFFTLNETIAVDFYDFYGLLVSSVDALQIHCFRPTIFRSYTDSPGT